MFNSHTKYKTSSSAIAETAGVTYLLSASLAYRHSAAQCADTQDLPIITVCER